MFVRKMFVCCLAAVVFAGPVFMQKAQAQGQPSTLSKLDRQRAEQMLQVISADITKHYYDPKLHGMDWNGTVATYKQKIETANSMNMALSIVAATLDSLNDSHTFFLPPQRPYTHDYGWKVQMIGERCFVTEVRPGSDAESKGVKPGDEVLSINGFAPDRQNMWKMNYLFNVLRPQPGLNIVVVSPTGQKRELAIMAKIHQMKRVMDITGENDASDIWQLIRQEEAEDHVTRVRYADVGDVTIIKLPEFLGYNNAEIWDILKKARDHKTLILDLRGNPGGSVDTLYQMIGHLYDHDVKVGNHIDRKESKPITVKVNSHDQVTDKLIVLVDSESASASELFARVVQLEKRGIVIGDHSAGAVMEAKHYSYTAGMDTVLFFGASITDADIVMTDGKSLEHVGITPDEVVLPTGADLAAGRDPVLAHAVALAGGNIDPLVAGKLFPYEWAPEQ